MASRVEKEGERGRKRKEERRVVWVVYCVWRLLLPSGLGC